MKKQRIVAIVAVVIVLLLATAPAEAQEPGNPAPVEPLPAWVDEITIGDVLLSGVAMAVTQVIKILLSRWIPDGKGGLIALIVSVILVAIAMGAAYTGAEQEIGDALLRVETGAKALMVFLGALGWYEINKRAELLPPVARG